LPHVEGTWNREGEANLIKLEPSQIFFLVNLFGFRRQDGHRRFTTALYAVARKNAKSTLAAAILLYCLCCENEVGPQILSAATTGDQARIVWYIAKRMVDGMDAQMREMFTLETFASSIARYEVGGHCKPINAKASTQDGLNPSALAFDELHAHKTNDLFNVLRSAVGARKNPLYLYTTTEGYVNTGPWAEERTFAQQLLEGIVTADHYLAVIYSLDDDDGDFKESAWIKANPLLGVSVSIDKMREIADEARVKPGTLSEFKIKRLNRAASSSASWIVLPRWLKCAGDVDLDWLKDFPCYGGLDLASTTDMCASRFVWLVDGVWYTWGRYWVPSSAVAQRNERGTVKYDAWIKAGFVTETEGNCTDYEVIRRDILDDCARFKVVEFGYDKWNSSQLMNQLVADQLPMIEVPQQPRFFNPAMTELERAYVSTNLRHGNNPVLNWNAANLVARRDVNNNLAPDKQKSPYKIDGIVAMLIAMSRAVMATSNKSFWE
jgi:phage terminase large subunit-like protein